MWFGVIYEAGRAYSYFPKVKGVDKKFKLAQFPYNSSEVLSGVLTTFLLFMILGTMFIVGESMMPALSTFMTFLGYAFLFFGLLVPLAAYVYATGIFYTHRMMMYREQMLRAILRLSTYTLLNMSMEYAMKETSENVTGILKEQLDDIIIMMEHKEKSTLGDAIKKYVEVWNEINPEFVKSLRLIQTASMSLPEDREIIIEEVLETIVRSYQTSGKRFAEGLANKTKTLIAIGVLFPIMSLMILPLISIFLPAIANPTIIAFVYVVFFPTILLIATLEFASHRVQVDTIELEQSPRYKKTPVGIVLFCIGMVIVFSIPTINHVMRIDMSTMNTVSREYTINAIVVIWLTLFGLFLAIETYSYLYVRRHERLWKEVYETERDFPHLLQTFASYLALNRSVESIIGEIEDDYITHGFKDHPVVKIFKEIEISLFTTKQSIEDIFKNVVPKICPSAKVSDQLRQIISFTTIDQKSAAKAARMVRKQLIAIYVLDDYIQSLLSDTVSLVSITTIMLAPLLCAASTIMAMAIVKALEFITKTLERIALDLGVTGISLELVDVTQIMPPTVVELIVGIYLLEMILILSLFMSNIELGTDKFRLAKTLQINVLVGFLIYTALLFIGYFVVNEMIFGGVLAR
jgi:hypothetical protein